MSDLPPLLGLNPLWPQAVQAPPLLQSGTQADHMQERPLATQATNRGPVIVVEVAVNGDPARLGEGDRLL